MQYGGGGGRRMCPYAYILRFLRVASYEFKYNIENNAESHACVAYFKFYTSRRTRTHNF